MFWCFVCIEGGKLSASTPAIGALGRSMTLQWSFATEKELLEVTFLVRHENATTLLKMWNIKFFSGEATIRSIKIGNELPEAIFNNNSRVSHNGSSQFNLTIPSVPSTIESFKFYLRASDDFWAVPSEEMITVKLTSEPFCFSFISIIKDPNSAQSVQ